MYSFMQIAPDCCDDTSVYNIQCAVNGHSSSFDL